MHVSVCARSHVYACRGGGVCLTWRRLRDASHASRMLSLSCLAGAGSGLPFSPIFPPVPSVILRLPAESEPGLKPMTCGRQVNRVHCKLSKLLGDCHDERAGGGRGAHQRWWHAHLRCEDDLGSDLWLLGKPPADDLLRGSRHPAGVRGRRRIHLSHVNEVAAALLDVVVEQLVRLFLVALDAAFRSACTRAAALRNTTRHDHGACHTHQQQRASLAQEN